MLAIPAAPAAIPQIENSLLATNYKNYYPL
jgi:hypothetical protein